ncbi:hypothetical protein PSU4_16560 [Pseudonocardia sulfidoxydans NBRC 16205]|uniref:Sulfate permease n=3 Tax=Pseudonocardia sulfidoxydans TaxID=54011 RepID=A0A511DD32_9PSEU|nr:DUF308 domain-containing protein [Pseudonocardia sulfidoxydans]GEL22702.1 hypothetical protein PSU4_16560 [Pseudonocardia sulfidoxydans NBRC 16205]
MGEATTRRSVWEIVLAVLLILGGAFLLSNAVMATLLSILLIGWTILVGGVLLVVRAIMRRESASVFWSALLGGAILAVLGLVVLRNPVVGAATLTLLAGAMFLVVGGVRIVLAIQVPGHRILLGISGLVSLVMGLIVLLNFTAATLTLLGILLGIQMLSEGIVLLLAGPLAPRGTGGRAAAGTPVGPGATSGTGTGSGPGSGRRG